MLQSEFEKIQQPTWVRIDPPDSPFTKRIYALITSVKRRVPTGGTDRSRYEAYAYITVNFVPEGWHAPGWKTRLPRKYLSYLFSDWNVKHMSLVKIIPSKTRKGFFRGIFNPKEDG